jgi:hypothetical protein
MSISDIKCRIEAEGDDFKNNKNHEENLKFY